MDGPPFVSVIVACKNVDKFLAHSVRSALAQSVVDLEVIIVDDGSTDKTRSVALALVKQDMRVRLLEGSGIGPAGARNVGLRQARGDWVAILDGDDLFHPERLMRLLEIAATSRSDVVADGLMAFTETSSSREAWTFFPPDFLLHKQLIDLERLFQRTKDGRESPLGYMKPLIRRDYIFKNSIYYNEALFIGEDFDFLARLLAAGAKMTVTPLPLYFYRRHSASISHRLSAKDATDMLMVAKAFAETYGPNLSPSARKSVSDRLGRLSVQKYTQDLIFALKDKAPAQAAKAALRCPPAIARTAFFLLEGLNRRLQARFHNKIRLTSLEPPEREGAEKAEPFQTVIVESIEGLKLACQIFQQGFGSEAETRDADPYWQGFVHPKPTFCE